MKKFIERIINVVTISIIIYLFAGLAIIPFINIISMVLAHTLTGKYFFTAIMKFMLFVNGGAFILCFNLWIKIKLEDIFNKKGE